MSELADYEDVVKKEEEPERAGAEGQDDEESEKVEEEVEKEVEEGEEIEEGDEDMKYTADEQAEGDEEQAEEMEEGEEMEQDAREESQDREPSDAQEVQDSAINTALPPHSLVASITENNANSDPTTLLVANNKTAAENASSGRSTASHSPYRPLNVKDALSYLDQVKIQFNDEPDVYNRFLDIMKDFKSQSIDTPGVIERVSALFRGNPMLISGFNTFLPPGYRIECSTNPHDPTIRVTTPLGTHHLANGQSSIQYNSFGESTVKSTTPVPSAGISAATLPPTIPSTALHGPSATAPFTSAAGTVYQPQPHAAIMAPVGTRPAMIPPPETAPFMPGHPLGLGPSSIIRRPPVEFNHAINYVNKIKNRFASEPDIYKQFLEILQTYQKEQKPIQEVYSQVTILFKSAPDLLDEFKQFLPESAAGPGNAPAIVGSTGAGGIFGPGIGLNARLPPVGNFPPPGTSMESYHKGSMPGSSMGGGGGKKKRSAMAGMASSKRTRHGYPKGSDISSVGEPGAAKPGATVEEVIFFDKVKKHIANKSVYNEFLKTLNLFSQEIVDQKALIDRVEAFLGNYPELFNWFKRFVGYKGDTDVISNVPAPRPKIDLMQCKAFGPSYRKLPKIETQLSCSGRDDLCWQVLNDEFVSHPTWASEDSGFVAHKKNLFEEALYKCEEERYEYDIYVEANLHTIALLEADCAPDCQHDD